MLDDLDRLYGHAYDLAVQEALGSLRAGTGRWLVGSCAAELRRLIDVDTAAG